MQLGTLRQHAKDARPLILLTAVLLSFVWTLVWMAIADARRSGEQDALREGEAMGKVIAEQVLRAVTAVDYALSFVAYELGENDATGRLAALIDRGAVKMSTLVLLSHVDAKGWLRQTNRGPSVPPIDLSDREHIRVHLDRRSQGLFIGKPVLGRASGKWSIQLTRGIIDAQGIVNGVIVASMDPRYFEQFWTGASLQNGYVIELIGTDGVVRARSENANETLAAGASRPDLARLAQTQTSGRIEIAAKHGEPHRTVIYHKVGNLPLLVTTTFTNAATESALTAVRSHYVMLGAVASLAILGLGLFVSWRTAELAAQRRRADVAGQRMRDAIESIPDGFALFDQQDRLLLFNQAYERIYATSRDLIREGTPFEAIVREGALRGRFPQAVGHLETWIEERLAAHRNPTRPYEQQTDDGRWLRIEERRTQDGCTVGIRADITQIKQRELALARQTELLTSTFEHMSEGLTVIDGEGTVVASNPRFAEIFSLPAGMETPGIRLSELLAIFGQSDHVLHEQTAGDAEEVLAQSLAEPDKAIAWYGANDRIVEVKSTRLPDGGAITIYTDVSRRRQDEKRIRRSEAQKSAMVASAFDGVIVTDGAGYILEYNQAAERIFGWTAREAIGSKLSELFVIGEPDIAGNSSLPFARELGEVVLGRLSELTGIDSAGRKFPVEVAVTEIVLDNGRLFSVYLRDISERKRVEEQMREARLAAEAANRAKSEFLAMVSHEVRTPMNGILGLTALLLDTSLDAPQRRFASGIHELANRLLALIGEILEFSRIEAGRLSLETAPFEIATLIQSAVETTRVLVGPKPIAVEATIEPKLPSAFEGDANRIYQVVHNLLANSAKFTERGRIDVTVRAVDDPTGDDRIRLRIEVRDTGPGIPADVQARLFTPFEQGGTDTARRFGGSGLGLAICRRLVDLMQGTIGFTSESGEGSVFWFELDLPRVAEGAISVAAALPAPITPMRRMRVLVAEDTPTSQLVVRSMLERLGHEVQVVADGAEAVEAASSAAFDVVLLDLQMPVLDGTEAARRIRALPSPGCDVFIAALTAQAHDGVRERTTAAGMNGFLVKPLSIERLCAVLTEAEVLLEAIRPGEGGRATSGASIADYNSMSGADLHGFDEFRRAVGDEVFGQLLQQFAIDCSAALSAMAGLVRTGDATELKRTAHKLAGLFGQFGFMSAAGMAEAVETAQSAEAALVLGSQLIELGRAAMAAAETYERGADSAAA